MHTIRAVGFRCAAQGSVRQRRNQIKDKYNMSGLTRTLDIRSPCRATARDYCTVQAGGWHCADYAVDPCRGPRRSMADQTRAHAYVPGG